MLLAKDRKVYSETVIHGMAQPIVMIMLTAWMLASTIGVLMSETGFVNALLWVASQLQLSAAGFTAVTFIICCLISLSTGSSFATILIVHQNMFDHLRHRNLLVLIVTRIIRSVD